MGSIHGGGWAPAGAEIPLFPPNGYHPRHFPNPATLNFGRHFVRDIRLADSAEIEVTPGIACHPVTPPVLFDHC